MYNAVAESGVSHRPAVLPWGGEIYADPKATDATLKVLWCGARRRAID